jgi:hypothetical protein
VSGSDVASFGFRFTPPLRRVEGKAMPCRKGDRWGGPVLGGICLSRRQVPSWPAPFTFSARASFRISPASSDLGVSSVRPAGRGQKVRVRTRVCGNIVDGRTRGHGGIASLPANPESARTASADVAADLEGSLRQHVTMPASQ